jgi:hypothetical protein
MSLSAVACGVGMFLFGYAMAVGANAVLCAFLQGVMNVGVLIGIFATLSYGLDAFRKESNEIFIMNMFFKVSSPVISTGCPGPLAYKIYLLPHRTSCSTA